MQRWKEEFVGNTQRKRVHVHHNGDFEHGKVLYMEPDWDHLEFLNAASQRLEMVPAANRVFNADGVEVDDCMMIEDDDMLFLSINDDFIAPADFISNDGDERGGEGEKIPHIIGGYKVTDLLGRGGFGEVRVGEHSLTGEKVALKFLRKSEILSLGAAERTNTEIQCLMALRHAHIIRLQHHMETQNHVVLVFELMQGGDLLQYLIKRKSRTGKACLTEDEARHVFYQVLSAVSYAHNQHICHRDLKLENILLKDTTLAIVKIADFGLSDFYRPGAMIKCSCGTLSFLAPEVFQGTANAGPPLDVWSMGVILFALVSGRLPFEGPDLASSKRPRDAVIRARIMKCQYKLDESLSGECKDLLRRLLVMDPTERMTIPELFNHIWVRTTVPAHVIESYKYEHFPTSERLKGDKDSFPAAQVHPLSLPDSTSTRPGVASPLPAEALTRSQKRTMSGSPDIPDSSTPMEPTELATSRRPSANGTIDDLTTPRSAKVFTFDPSPRTATTRNSKIIFSNDNILSNGSVDPLSRENSEETDAVSVAESVGVSERSEVKPMIKLIPLRKELRVEDSIRRMSVNSTNDDDLSVTSARSSIPSSGTGSRRPSEAQHFVPRRSEILNNHYDNRTNSKTAQKSDLSPNGRALDNDSLYQLMTPPRTATNSPSPAGDGHAPLNLTEVARSRNSLTKKDRDPPGYMGDKGRHHVALAGVASIQGNKLGYGNSDSGSSTARSRTNSVNQGGANVGKPRFGV